MMGGPRLSPVFLKHKIPSWVEELMKIEENVANGEPQHGRGYSCFFFFKLATVGNRADGRMHCRNGTTHLLHHGTRCEQVRGPIEQTRTITGSQLA